MSVKSDMFKFGFLACLAEHGISLDDVNRAWEKHGGAVLAEMEKQADPTAWLKSLMGGAKGVGALGLAALFGLPILVGGLGGGIAHSLVHADRSDVENEKRKQKLQRLQQYVQQAKRVGTKGFVE